MKNGRAAFSFPPASSAATLFAMVAVANRLPGAPRLSSRPENALRENSRQPNNAYRVLCAEGSGPDPYGNLIDYTYDASVEDNPFRFSTKYWDDETGLYYYGLRFYDPAFGKWISRDSIEEMGGLGLYAFVQNTPANGFDAIGRDFQSGEYPVRAPENSGLLGETQPGLPTIAMKVSLDPACASGACWRLSFVDIDMYVRIWYIWWRVGVRAHERLHVGDFEEITYNQSEAYAKSFEGCYPNEVAHCLKNAIEQIVPSVYLHLGGFITIDRRDLAREPGDSNYLLWRANERGLYDSWKSRLEAKLAECRGLSH